MGLGKTVQISTYLTSLKIANLINKALVVVPATLVEYWVSEIKRWTPEDQKVRVINLYGNKPQRQRIISSIINQKCVCVISPESFKSDLEDL